MHYRDKNDEYSLASPAHWRGHRCAGARMERPAAVAGQPTARSGLVCSGRAHFGDIHRDAGAATERRARGRGAAGNRPSVPASPDCSRWACVRCTNLRGCCIATRKRWKSFAKRSSTSGDRSSCSACRSRTRCALRWRERPGVAGCSTKSQLRVRPPSISRVMGTSRPSKRDCLRAAARTIDGRAAVSNDWVRHLRLARALG